MVKTRKDFYIAGIGASAGGLEALSLFFDHLAGDLNIAYIVIQHLDPTHKSLLPELLSRHTKMEVYEATNGLAIKPNTIYTIPSKNYLILKDGKLFLELIDSKQHLRHPIDLFFKTLAKEKKSKAIGIVLSGTGSDGTNGLKSILENGGNTIAQDPSTPQFDEMPMQAIKANVVKSILSPEKIPSKLKSITHSNSLKKTTSKEFTDIQISSRELESIITIIKKQTGNDFSNYKSNTILRRIKKRIESNHLKSVKAYIKFLQINKEEVEKLYLNFLIGVTSFFRDKEIFSEIEKKIIPNLLKNCASKQELRVWVCGCSTGEEAYSLAILIHEALEINKQYLKVVIFASDIDKQSIDIARSGIYSENAISVISPERLSRYFIKIEKGYQLCKEIREMIVFSHHNVIKDPPYSRIDMITCRNMLIYMNSSLQTRVIQLFNYSLNDDGLLLLGTSESIGESSDLFTPLNAKIKVYMKKENTFHNSKNGYELTKNQTLLNTQSLSATGDTIRKLNISNLTSKILADNYAPPSVIIDKNNAALYFSGNSKQFLELPNGEASLNILDLICLELKKELTNAILETRSKKSECTTHTVVLNKLLKSVIIRVKPISTKDLHYQGLLMLVFESTALPSKKTAATDNKNPQNLRALVIELQHELDINKQRLQNAITNLELSNENLQSANEEYQSSNEELQSSNEELETSREELHSVNEELITINSELSTKIEQLSQSNDDLSNLLSSIEVATIFLDSKLRIKRFTPAATRIFNIIPTDLDRPMTHLTGNINYKSMSDDVKEVLKTLVPKSIEIKGNGNTWFKMRILPYRTTENIIEGVLITFIDITEHKNIEEQLKKSDEHLNLIMEYLPAIPFIYTYDKELRITFAGKTCEKLTGFKPEQFIEKSSFWINRIHKADSSNVLNAIRHISKNRSEDIAFRWKCANGKYKNFISSIRFAAAEKGRQNYTVGIWQEIKIIKETNEHREK